MIRVIGFSLFLSLVADSKIDAGGGGRRADVLLLRWHHRCAGLGYIFIDPCAVRQSLSLPLAKASNQRKRPGRQRC
jgi:hypothetical protein